MKDCILTQCMEIILYFSSVLTSPPPPLHHVLTTVDVTSSFISIKQNVHDTIVKQYRAGVVVQCFSTSFSNSWTRSPTNISNSCPLYSNCLNFVVNEFNCGRNLRFSNTINPLAIVMAPWKEFSVNNWQKELSISSSATVSYTYSSF